MEKPPSSVLPNITKDVRSIYTLGRKLGQGQFGTTYLCTEKSTGDEYACKSISKKKILSAQDRSDVYREIQIMHHVSSLSNVAKIKGAYEDVNDVHIVMELCVGGELFDRIVKKKHYSEREAAKLMKTIAGFVEACHSLGVAHKDLKPENFLFETTAEDSPLKATDFGLSAFFQPGMTFTNLVGSPYYIAPGVLDRNYGPEADVWSAGVILYILLSGRPPFWAGTSLGIFRKIMTGKYNLESKPWESVSDRAKDLIRKMLETNPQKRLSAYQVLCHPWMVDEMSVPDKPLDPVVLSRLKQFSAMNNLKKMACRVIAQKLSKEEIGGLKELFKLIDTDQSGTITYEELKQSLKRLDSQLKESEIEDLMNAADIDQNGIIDYEEFLAATLHLNKLEMEENLVSTFAYFDKDGSGYITIDELQQACKEIGIKGDDVVNIIKDIDEDKDGRIDYGEFVAMMRRDNVKGYGRRNMRGISWEDAIHN